MCVIAVAGADLVRDKAPARWDTPRPRQLAAASPSAGGAGSTAA